MFTNKVTAVFLVCHMALALALPAMLDDRTSIKLVQDGSRGEENVQKLIDELGRGRQTQPGKNTVVKKTTTTTTIEEEPKNEDDELNEFMKDPKFAQQLKEFLAQFLQIYNSMNRMQKGGSSVKTITEENMDVQSLLKNPSFFSFLTNFFNNQSEDGGISGFLSNLFNQVKRPTNTRPTVTRTETVTNEENTRPVETAPKVTVTRVETTDTTDTEEPTRNFNAADKILNKFTTTNENRPVQVETEEIDSRFDNFEPKITVTQLGTDNRDNNAISTSEQLLDELKSSKFGSTDESITRNVVKPSVFVHNVPSVSEDWAHANNKVENSADFKQQAKNAQYQFATQIDDKINGNFQQRAEVRKGGVLYGKYSYDDGYSWRTYYYQADSNGYRVTKEEVLPSHMKEHSGDASVQTLVDGNLVDYHITEKDIPSLRSSSNSIRRSQIVN